MTEKRRHKITQKTKQTSSPSHFEETVVRLPLILFGYRLRLMKSEYIMK
jgi:hypothetical protein